MKDKQPIQRRPDTSPVLLSHCLPSASDDRTAPSLRPRASADRLTQHTAHPILDGIDEESEESEQPEYLHCIYSRRGSPDNDLPRERTAKARARASFGNNGTSYSAGQSPRRGSGNLDRSPKGAGPARPYRFARICHVCGAKTNARLYCHSCGHPLCPSCTCEVPENTPEAHRAFLAMIKKAGDVSRSSDTAEEQVKKDDVPPPKPLTRKGTVSEHPFLQADREVRRSIAAERDSEQSIDADNATESSHAPDEMSSSSAGQPSTDDTLKAYPQLQEKKSSRSLPKVRAASPPSWLKHPSKEPSTIDGRLQETNARSRLRGSEPSRPTVKTEPSWSDIRGKLKATTIQPPREFKRAEIPPLTLRRSFRSLPSSKKSIESDNQVSIPSPVFENQPTAEVVRRASRLFRTDSDQRSMTVNVSDSSQEPQREEPQSEVQPEAQPEVPAQEIERSPPYTERTTTPEAQSATEPQSEVGPQPEPKHEPETETEPEQEVEPRPESSAQRVSLEMHHPDPIMPPNHNCAWRDQYNALATEMLHLKAEMASKEEGERDGDGNKGREEDNDDNPETDELGGLEGLTIVMHLKGKEDLVINTDLREAAGE